MRNFADSKRAGQGHAKAILSDHEVELMRELHEVDGWSYGRLANKFEVSKSAVASICRYRTR